jgi:NADPH-dependent F420 reductase
MQMDIAIIGVGNIGGTLGKIWAAKGHQIIFGVRDPNSPKAQGAREVAGARITSPAEAAAAANVILLAVPWPAARETLAGLGNLSGKILIDPTNHFVPPEPEHGSSAEDIAHWAPGARVVKAFNTTGWETLLNPQIGGERVTVMVASDDAEARALVMGLVEDVGLDAANAGGLAAARSLEAFTHLWVGLTRAYGRKVGFRILRE